MLWYPIMKFGMEPQTFIKRIKIPTGCRTATSTGEFINKKTPTISREATIFTYVRVYRNWFIHYYLTKFQALDGGNSNRYRNGILVLSIGGSLSVHESYAGQPMASMASATIWHKPPANETSLEYQEGFTRETSGPSLVSYPIFCSRITLALFTQCQYFPRHWRRLRDMLRGRHCGNHLFYIGAGSWTSGLVSPPMMSPAGQPQIWSTQVSFKYSLLWS